MRHDGAQRRQETTSNMEYPKRLTVLALLAPFCVEAFLTSPLSCLNVARQSRLTPACRQRWSSSLNMMAKPLQLGEQDSFDDVVLKSDVPVLVDFHAVLLAPVMDQMAEEYQGKLKVVKVDCDTHKDLMNYYKARGLPMMAIFDKGELLKRQEGILDFKEVGALVSKFVPEFQP